MSCKGNADNARIVRGQRIITHERCTPRNIARCCPYLHLYTVCTTRKRVLGVARARNTLQSKVTQMYIKCRHSRTSILGDAFVTYTTDRSRLVMLNLPAPAKRSMGAYRELKRAPEKRQKQKCPCQSILSAANTILGCDGAILYLRSVTNRTTLSIKMIVHP